MSYVIINGNKYDIPEVNFDSICELEERGVNLLNPDTNNAKLATMCRGLAAWIMGTDVYTASRELEAHVMNGGNILDIINGVTDAINNSGFFKQGGKKQPQDHRRKHGGRVTQYPQNRAQRRAINKNQHANGNH